MVHKPTVLFLCIHNAGRSEITAAYLTHLTNDNTIQVHSTGSAPVPSINPIVMQAIMKKESTSRVRTRSSLRTKRSRNVMLLLWAAEMLVLISRGRDMLTGGLITLPGRGLRVLGV